MTNASQGLPEVWGNLEKGTIQHQGQRTQSWTECRVEGQECGVTDPRHLTQAHLTLSANTDRKLFLFIRVWFCLGLLWSSH